MNVGSGRVCSIYNVADGSIGGQFHVREYTKNPERRMMKEQVLGGKTIRQVFPVDDTDRTFIVTGILFRATYDAVLEPVFTASTNLAVFQDGDDAWEVVIENLTWSPGNYNKVTYTMEMGVCRKLT